MDSAGSNYNDAFDDSTLSAVDIENQHDFDTVSGPSTNSTKHNNGSLDIDKDRKISGDGFRSEPFVMYKNRNAVDNGITRIQSQKANNGSLNKFKCTEYEATGKTPKLGKLYEKPKYEAESPDEEALVKGAHLFGYTLKARFPGSIRLRLPSGIETDFELLHTLPFDSTRKRMSIIVRNPEGEVQLFCKGADTVIMSRLGNYTGM